MPENDNHFQNNLLLLSGEFGCSMAAYGAIALRHPESTERKKLDTLECISYYELSL